MINILELLVKLSVFRYLTKDNTILFNHILNKTNFTISNDHPEYDTPGYSLYVFDIPFDRDFATPEPMK